MDIRRNLGKKLAFFATKHKIHPASKSGESLSEVQGSSLCPSTPKSCQKYRDMPSLRISY
jgi:hypothetical protein